MICILYRAKLFAFAAGELNREQHEKFEHHVRRCSRCQARVAEIRLLNSRMRSVAPIPFEPDGTLWPKLETLIAPGKSRQPVGTGGFLSLGLAVAAFVAIVFLVNGQKQDTAPVQQARQPQIMIEKPVVAVDKPAAKPAPAPAPITRPPVVDTIKARVERVVELPESRPATAAAKRTSIATAPVRKPEPKLTRVASASPVKAPGVVKKNDSYQYVATKWLGPEDTTAVEPDRDELQVIASGGATYVAETIDEEERSSAVERVYTAVEAKSKAIFWY